MRHRLASRLCLAAVLSLATAACSTETHGVSAAGGTPQSSSLTGAWCARVNDPSLGTPYTVELSFDGDGIQFQEQYVYSTGGVISIFGDFRVFDNPVALRLDTAGGYPATDQAGAPLSYPAETYCYSLKDQDHLVLDVATWTCAGGPDSCVARCCDARLRSCVTREHRRGSCNQPVAGPVSERW